MKRRGFIQGLLGLAALAVAPTVPAQLIQTESDRFLAEAATGLIRNKVFYLDGPVTLIGVRNLTIDSCSFFCKNVGDKALLTLDDCEGLTIMNCLFQGDA
jgi:hypothetical protein